MQNLRSIALAVGAGEPVLLQGPVGCGKTSLVEHLAHVTGRTGAPLLLTVQLGDQTDSRVTSALQLIYRPFFIIMYVVTICTIVYFSSDFAGNVQVHRHCG